MVEIDLLEHFLKLSEIERTGWVREGVQDPESVAEHSYLLSVLAMRLSKYFDFDDEKFLKICIVHDLPESVIGDIVYYRGREKVDSKENKLEKEKGVLESILPEDDEILDLWHEYEKGSSKEGRIAKQLDKVTTAARALSYEKEFDLKLDEFWECAEKHVENNVLEEVLGKLEKERPSHRE